MTAQAKTKARVPATSSDLPEPSAEEQALQVESLRKHVGRRRPASVKLTTDEDGGHRITAPHTDQVGWTVRVNEAVGGASVAFGRTQLGHLSCIALANPEKAESATNSMLAAVEAVRPGNEVEGMLAVQMAATHQAAMQCLGKACQAEQPQTAEAMGSLANKLMRAYTLQVEALAKLRRGGEQTVRVEHVHVYAGGQAIVGEVRGALGATWGDQKNGSQPHALTASAALALPAGASVLCEDQGGDRVPVAGREGQDAVPDARRRSRGRRSEG